MNKVAAAVVFTVLAFVAVLILTVLGIVYTGAFNVAASQKDSALMRWFLRETMDHSVERRAERLAEQPGFRIPDLKNPESLREGLEHYNEMCFVCHGAPGYEKTEIGRGLNPRPPRLWRNHNEPAEDYWVVKNGIRMTGMPSFGETHNDQQLWAMVAFLDQLRHMDEHGYEAAVRAAGLTMPETDEEEHEHESASPESSTTSQPLKASPSPETTTAADREEGRQSD